MDIADFYDADARRRPSPEVGFGDGWTVHSDGGATFRAALVVDTGELYLIREPHPGGPLAPYLDELGVGQADVGELTVEVLAHGVDVAAVMAALQGWEEAMTERDSLVWLRERVGRLSGGG